MPWYERRSGWALRPGWSEATRQCPREILEERILNLLSTQNLAVIAAAATNEFPGLLRSSHRTRSAGPDQGKGVPVAHPVVHFEIIGKDPDKLRNYFGELFGWQFDTSSPVAEAVSEPTDYGFVDRITTPDGTGIPGGIGGGAAYPAHIIFYVGVPSVESALVEAERLGGKRRMGPERAPTGLVVGHFTDPEGNLIGVAGTA